MNAAYLDASALVKLFKREPETDALRAALAQWPVRVASELIRVEAICTARRIGGKDALERAHATLARLTLLPIDSQIVNLAAEEHQPLLRAMDAIHLATALSARADLGVVFVYDADLHAAAHAQGLNALAPA